MEPEPAPPLADRLVAIAEFGPPTRTLPDDLGFGVNGFARRHAEATALAIDAHLPPGARDTPWPKVLEEALKSDGPAGIGMFGSGQWTIFEGYAAAKLWKAGFRSNNLDPNARHCMASAVTGAGSISTCSPVASAIT